MADKQVIIQAPKIELAIFELVGTQPYIQLRFGKKAIDNMKAKMELGSQARKGKAREARSFDDDFQQAIHKSSEGWCGIPASSFRNAMISACRLVGFKMTLAKLSVFVEGDGLDDLDSTPLVRIDGTPEPLISPCRNATGVCDLRVRAKYWPWSCKLRVSFDQDQFALEDIDNLLKRVGQQVGIGEGRPDSKNSAGMGWGLFQLR